MADDTDDDDTPPAKSSKKGPKKRFGERDASDDEDDDRPRKKKRPADDEDAEDDKPRSKRKAEDEDGEEETPRKTRRAGRDRQVKGNEGIPLVMLLAFIGSAVALLGICVGCGWLSFAWAFPDSGGGGGGGGGWGGGNEFEVVSASRQQPFRPFDGPNVSWTVKSLKEPSKDGYYFVVMKSGSQSTSEQLSPSGKGWSMSSGKPRNELKGATGKVEVWVEKRQTPVGSGKVVSNVYVVP